MRSKITFQDILENESNSAAYYTYLEEQGISFLLDFYDSIQNLRRKNFDVNLKIKVIRWIFKTYFRRRGDQINFNHTKLDSLGFEKSIVDTIIEKHEKDKNLPPDTFDEAFNWVEDFLATRSVKDFLKSPYFINSLPVSEPENVHVRYLEFVELEHNYVIINKNPWESFATEGKEVELKTRKEEHEYWMEIRTDRSPNTRYEVWKSGKEANAKMYNVDGAPQTPEMQQIFVEILQEGLKKVFSEQKKAAFKEELRQRSRDRRNNLSDNIIEADTEDDQILLSEHASQIFDENNDLENLSKKSRGKKTNRERGEGKSTFSYTKEDNHPDFLNQSLKSSGYKSSHILEGQALNLRQAYEKDRVKMQQRAIEDQRNFFHHQESQRNVSEFTKRFETMSMESQRIAGPYGGYENSKIQGQNQSNMYQGVEKSTFSYSSSDRSSNAPRFLNLQQNSYKSRNNMSSESKDRLAPNKNYLGHLTNSRIEKSNSNHSTQIIANIKLFGSQEDLTYNVKIPTESSINPVVTLGQLKKKLPAKNPSAFTYYFQTEQNGEFFEEDDDETMLPILPGKYGGLRIIVQCHPLQ